MRSLLLVLAFLSAFSTVACGQEFETLFADNQGRRPWSTLVKGSDGNFYGTTYEGGARGYGTIFRVTPTGELTTLVSFRGSNGSKPTAGLVEGSDGNFYGTTSEGGVTNEGTVFRMTPDGVLATLASFRFSNGASPRAKLVEGIDGSFYGTTIGGGGNHCGTIFKITPAGTLTSLVHFSGTNGKEPFVGLVKGNDGNFYGTTVRGGASDNGTIFKVTPAGALTTLFSFNSTDGSSPSAGLVEGRDGSFYGATAGGGGGRSGTIFKITPAGVFITLVAFNFTDGSNPSAGLVEGSDGSFYGTTTGGGASGYGTIFKVTPAGVLTTLVSFNSSNGSIPRVGIVEGSDGSFYGTTFGDRMGDDGAIFKVTPAGELTTLFSFNSDNGSKPLAGLVNGSDGNFYGTTTEGGVSNRGTIFKVTPAGELTTLVSFNSTNGRKPYAKLVEGSDGNFYGTTSEGGADDYGTIFMVTPAGELTTLVSFNFSNGRYPEGGLVKGSDGNFYGTTSQGGADDYGTIFKMTPAGALTTLISFNSIKNISLTSTELLEGSDGSFYGTTFGGGARGQGTIFRVTPAGVLSSLVSFDSMNGSGPRAGLAKGTDGNFYGTTSEGGVGGYGTVFKMTPAGEYSTVVYFNSTNGSSPRAGLVLGGDGDFYGVTESGGANGYGTIFKMTLSGALTTLHSFDGATGAYQHSTPVFGNDGNLYGMASQMAIWRLFFPKAPVVKTNLPASLTTTGATLTGIVDAHGADTTVAFEYGLTPVYSSTVAAFPETVTDRDAIPVSATLSGLAPHTTYYYRITASNSEGSTSTAGASFTTANSLPVATNDGFAPVPSEFGSIALAVLGNDSDADGDSLTITGLSQGSFGAVTTDGATLTYTPRSDFLGRDSFSYTISDGFDTVTAQVELWANELFTRVLLNEGSGVPSAGEDGSGIPHGALFKNFGVPSINSAGKLAFTASYATPGLGNELSVFGYESQAMKSTLAASWGQTAPGTDGARFISFKEPLLNEAGDVAFLATLSGGDTTKKSREGIWVRSFSEAGGGETELIARTGAQPPGVAEGARWKRFMEVVFSSGGSADADNDGWSLAFTGFMGTGAGGVKGSTDMGLWIANPEGTVLALREGQKLFIGETEKQLRSFAALKALPNAAGQGSGVSSAGGVAVQAFFEDGSQALLRVSRNDAGTGGEIEIETLALPGDAIADVEETAAAFGLPTQSGSGAVTSWIGALSGKGNPAAILQRNESDLFFLKRVASKGDAAPGIDSATFSSFRSVAVSDSGSALFLGKVKGRGVSKSNDDGLWWKQLSSNDESSSFQLLAREGTQPPGAPEGARWSTFTSLALSDGQYGPLFTARLAGAKGKAGQGWGSSANDQGLWALDSQGELQLIVREGQEVTVPGSETPRTLRSFTVLSAVPGSAAQRRSFDDEGLIIYRALFTDGSQAIVKVQVP